MSTPKRFTNGVTNVASDKNLGQYLAPDPTLVHQFFNDFNIYLATEWTVTTTEAGAGDATEAIEDEDSGVLLLTNDDADDDLDFLQTVDEIFALESGKKCWFKARLKVSDAIQSDFVVGLQVRDTTPLAVTDGVWFQKDDGDDDLDFHIAKASSQSSQSNIATIVDDTYLTVGFYFDGLTTIHYYINDVELGTVETSDFPTTELCVSFGIQNGEAVAKTMSVDFLFASKER